MTLTIVLFIRVYLGVFLFDRVRDSTRESGPRFTKNLKSDRNSKHISGAKMCFTKIHNTLFPFLRFTFFEIYIVFN